MKRIWFGGALLIVLLILGLCSGALMERTHLVQAEELDRAARLALSDRWDGAEAAFLKARDSWASSVPLVAALTDHEPMDEIEGFFGELEVFLRLKDASSFSASCLYLARQLEALGKSHSLNLQNLF